MGPTVDDALRAADNVNIREEGGGDRTGDGLVVAHRDGIDRATVAASITAIEFGENVYGREWFYSPQSTFLLVGSLRSCGSTDEISGALAVLTGHDELLSSYK